MDHLIANQITPLAQMISKVSIQSFKTVFSVLLRELDEYGFTDLTGVDYAAGSVQLAANICKDLRKVKI